MKLVVRNLFILGLVLLNTACLTKTVVMSDSDCGQGFYSDSNGDCLYWHESTVTFHFSTGSSSVSSALKNDVIAAANEWNRYIASPKLVISGTEVADNGTDGVNVIHFEQSYWDPTISNVQGRTSILAGSKIVETDIEFNLVDFDMSVGAKSFKVDMKSLALHEFGHALGLIHAEEYFGSVMSSTLAYNYNRRCLFDRDAGIIGNIYQLVDTIPATLNADTYFGWGKSASSC